MNARQAARARHHARVARTLQSPEVSVSGHHGTEIGRAANAGRSQPSPAAAHEMTAYELAATRAYADGRRDQRCPACGREESGGSYCTGCYRPVHPDEWTNDTAASRSGRAAAAARRSNVTRPNPEAGFWPA